MADEPPEIPIPGPEDAPHAAEHLEFRRACVFFAVMLLFAALIGIQYYLIKPPGPPTTPAAGRIKPDQIQLIGVLATSVFLFISTTGFFLSLFNWVLAIRVRLRQVPPE